jgi:hypothetical protein
MSDYCTCSEYHIPIQYFDADNDCNNVDKSGKIFLSSSEKPSTYFITVPSWLAIGWLYAIPTGVYGTNYLFRAAVTQLGLGANITQEALYPITFTDNQGKPLTGANNYKIHFNPGQTPPVNAFWSITMYNSKVIVCRQSNKSLFNRHIH